MPAATAKPAKTDNRRNVKQHQIPETDSRFSSVDIACILTTGTRNSGIGFGVRSSESRVPSPEFRDPGKRNDKRGSDGYKYRTQ